MSKFNNYARELNTIATKAFTAFTEADKRLKSATEVMNKYNRYGGRIPQGLEAEHARAQANYYEAKDALSVAKKGLSIANNEVIKELRNNLLSDIEVDCMANPAHLNTGTLELLKSGILSVNEYAHLLEQAKSEGNNTMVRLIGKYAADAAEKETDQTQAAALRGVSYDSKTVNGMDRVEAFDIMLDIMNRITNDPGLINWWDELTSDIVENF